MELLAFGKTGWGDELFYATLMTVAVSVTAMLVGFLFALIFTPLKLSKYKTLNFVGNFYTTVIRGVPLNIYEYPYANLLTKIFLLILNIAKKSPTNSPKNKDADKSFKVIKAALKSLGKLLIIKSKSINIPYYI